MGSGRTLLAVGLLAAGVLCAFLVLRVPRGRDSRGMPAPASASPENQQQLASPLAPSKSRATTGADIPDSEARRGSRDLETVPPTGSPGGDSSADHQQLVARLNRLEKELAARSEMAFRAQREAGLVHESYLTEPGAAPVPASVPSGRRMLQVVINPVERFNPNYRAGDPVAVWHLVLTPENSAEVFALEDEVTELRALISQRKP